MKMHPCASQTGEHVAIRLRCDHLSAPKFLPSAKLITLFEEALFRSQAQIFRHTPGSNLLGENASSRMIFCIDSSAWMDGWVRDYPPDVFPTLWNNLDAHIEKGIIMSIS